LAGKAAEFTVNVNEVQKAEKAEVNDEFAKKFNFENLDALRDAIKANLLDTYEQSARIKIKKQLFDALDKEISFDVPPSMFDFEFNSIWRNVEQAKKEGDESLLAKSEEELRAEYSKIAKRRVKLGIFLSEIATKNTLTVTKEDLSRAISEQAKQFPGNEGMLYQFYQKNPEQLQQLHGPIMEEKAVDFIIEKAKINEKKISAEELMKDEDDAEDDTVNDKVKKVANG
ncbi:MAG: trigger factor, partial [Pseudomonadota bacterium]